MTAFNRAKCARCNKWATPHVIEMFVMIVEDNGETGSGEQKASMAADLLCDGCAAMICHAMRRRALAMIDEAVEARGGRGED